MQDLPRLALSIMQPWAWLIAHQHKHVENRDWKPWNSGLKFRGHIAIHAGKKIDKEAAEDVQGNVHPVIYRYEAFDAPATFETGGIVGIAEIIDVVTDSESPWFVGRYGLVIRNARPIPFIPCKGQLGFFDWRKNIGVSSNA